MITLTRQKVQEEWGTILEACQGEGEGLLQAVEARLTQLHPPDATWRRESMAPNAVMGLAGKRRDGLVVANGRFRDHRLCVFARDYGATLDVCWYLSGTTRGWILGLLARIPILNRFLNLVGILRNLDVFDLQDLRAWTTVVHEAVRHAVEEVKTKRHLEVATDWKSRGMFGIS